jgi:hypothetical protein
MAAPAIALYIDGGAFFLFLFLGGQKRKYKPAAGEGK